MLGQQISCFGGAYDLGRGRGFTADVRAVRIGTGLSCEFEPARKVVVRNQPIASDVGIVGPGGGGEPLRCGDRAEWHAGRRRAGVAAGGHGRRAGAGLSSQRPAYSVPGGRGRWGPIELVAALERGTDPAESGGRVACASIECAAASEKVAAAGTSVADAAAGRTRVDHTSAVPSRTVAGRAQWGQAPAVSPFISRWSLAWSRSL